LGLWEGKGEYLAGLKNLPPACPFQFKCSLVEANNNPPGDAEGSEAARP
jgi:hypothetical protein